MISRCPLVTGSNDPGQTTRRLTRTHSPVSDGTAASAPAARPYQRVASPYLRDRSGRYPRGQGGGPDLVARSTTISAAGASQPCSSSAASIRSTSSWLAAYG